MHFRPVKHEETVGYASPPLKASWAGWSRSSRPDWLLWRSPGRTIDLCCLCTALFLVVMHPSLSASQSGLADMLRLRFSLQNILVSGVCVVLWSVILRDASPGRNRSRPLSLRILSFAWQVVACSMITGLLLLIRHPEMASFGNLGLFALLSTLFLFLCRVASGTYKLRIQPAMRKQRVVLIVGAGWRGEKMNAELLSHPRWNYRSLGFVDTNSPNPKIPLLGSVDDLETILMNNAIDEVIITLPIKSMYDQIQKVIAVCERTGVQSRYLTDLFATQVTKRRSTDEHHPSSVLLHLVHDQRGYPLKRTLDVAVATSGLLVFSPLLLLIVAAISLTSKGPILFRQKRYGLNKRLFTMYKFRSMVVDAEQQQAKIEHLNETGGAAFKLARDPRVTAVGQILRKTSLDELPQLWNVLIGNMSLVGPRPLPVRDVERFSESWLMRRFSVAPGITGLWQVSGRSNTTFSSWMALDLSYIDNWSFSLDLKILARTLPAVLKGEGAV